jgi:hypothetical protein
MCSPPVSRQTSAESPCKYSLYECSPEASFTHTHTHTHTHCSPYYPVLGVYTSYLPPHPTWSLQDRNVLHDTHYMASKTNSWEFVGKRYLPNSTYSNVFWNKLHFSACFQYRHLSNSYSTGLVCPAQNFQANGPSEIILAMTEAMFLLSAFIVLQ